MVQKYSSKIIEDYRTILSITIKREFQRTFSSFCVAMPKFCKQEHQEVIVGDRIYELGKTKSLLVEIQ